MTAIATEAEAPAYDAELAAEAQAAYSAAREAGWPGETAALAMPAAAALKEYRDLVHGIVPAWFPGIKAGPEGFRRALYAAAENAFEKAEELARLLPAAAEEGGR